MANYGWVHDPTSLDNYVADGLETAGKTATDAEDGGVGALTLASMVPLGAGKAVKNAGNLVLGSKARSNLRRNLGLSDNRMQAHHLVRYAIAQESEAIKHAMKNGLYDINRKENGIALPRKSDLAEELGLPQHNGSHPIYSNKIQNLVLKLDEDFAAGNMSSKVLLARITEIEAKARSIVTNTSGKLR